MPYLLKLFLYFAVWWIAGAIGRGWLSDSNFFTVFGIALLMTVAMVLICRRLFGRDGL